MSYPLYRIVVKARVDGEPDHVVTVYSDQRYSADVEAILAGMDANKYVTSAYRIENIPGERLLSDVTHTDYPYRDGQIFGDYAYDGAGNTIVGDYWTARNPDGTLVEAQSENDARAIIDAWWAEEVEWADHYASMRAIHRYL